MSIPVMNVSRTLASALLIVGLGMTGCGKDQSKPVTLAGTGDDSPRDMASESVTAKAWNRLAVQLLKWPVADEVNQDAQMKPYGVSEPREVRDMWDAAAVRLREMEEAGYLACFKAMHDAPQAQLRCGFGGSAAAPGGDYTGGLSSTSSAGHKFNPKIGDKSLSPLAACDSAGQYNPDLGLASDEEVDAYNAAQVVMNFNDSLVKTLAFKRENLLNAANEAENNAHHATDSRLAEHYLHEANMNRQAALDADVARVHAESNRNNARANMAQHQSVMTGNALNPQRRAPSSSGSAAPRKDGSGSSRPQWGEDGPGGGLSRSDCKERQKVFARSVDGIKQYISRAQQQSQLTICNERVKDEGGAADPRCNLGGGSKLGQSNCPAERLNCGDKNSPRNNPKYGGNAPVPGKTAGGCDPNKSQDCY